jgi:DNA-binding IclR family transcriptional regulator
MARITQDQKDLHKKQLLRLLHGHYMGLSEAEIAAEMGWQRRTVNNYLRDLEIAGLVYQDGIVWHLAELES